MELDQVMQQLIACAKKYPIQQLILFGSRARGDNRERSDYDIAVYATKMSELDKAKFYLDVEDIHTLHKIDIVYIDSYVREEFLHNIEKDGIPIYEQI